MILINGQIVSLDRSSVSALIEPEGVSKRYKRKKNNEEVKSKTFLRNKPKARREIYLN